MKFIRKNTLISLIILTSAYLKVYPEETKNIVSRGKIFSELKPFDELMEKFVSDNKIPGASLAVAKDGRPVSYTHLTLPTKA